MNECVRLGIETWTQLSLPAIQQRLDRHSLQVTEAQTKAIVSKKSLAQATKEFKKLFSTTSDSSNTSNDGENLVAGQILLVLKQYQKEIDIQSQRAKQSEVVILELNYAFAELVDPISILSSLSALDLDSMQAMTKKSQSLIIELKSRDDLVVELQGKLNESRDSMTVLIGDRVRDQTAILNQDFNEKYLVFAETEKADKKMIAHLRKEFHDLRECVDSTTHSNREDTLLDSLNQGFTTAQSNSQFNSQSDLSAEIKILWHDLEDRDTKIHSLNQQLIIAQSNLQSDILNKSDKSNVLDKENKSNVLDKENKSNVLDKGNKSNELGRIERDQSIYNDQQRIIESSTLKLIALDHQLQAQKSVIDQANHDLALYTDYEAIKQELAIFKGLEVEGGSDINQPLEKILLAKNKRLENEFTRLKMSNSDLLLQIESETSRSKVLFREYAGKDELIAKLEEDLRNNYETNQTNHADFINDGKRSSNEHLESLMSSFKSIHTKDQSIDTTNTTSKTDTIKKTSVKTNESSIVPMLTSQRDRYKQRFEEAHRSTLDLSNKLITQSIEVDKLKSDNLILYEKVKYQQTYTPQSTTHQSSYHSTTVEARYKPIYESSIDPFARFRELKGKMNASDRVVMRFTRLLTGDRYSRMAFIGYILILHFLVVFALYEMMGADSYSKPFHGGRFNSSLGH